MASAASRLNQEEDDDDFENTAGFQSPHGRASGAAPGRAPDPNIFTTATAGFTNVQQVGLAGPLQFQSPPTFNGKREEFEEFAFKLRAYMSLINPRYNKIMSELTERTEPVEEAEFFSQAGEINAEMYQMAVQLHWILITLLSGSASTFLRRETSTNGFECWRKLCQRYMLPSRAKAVGRLTRILKPSFNMNAFEDTFSAWEDEITRYEKETQTRLTDEVKIAIIMTEVSGSLQEHLRLNAATITKYDEFKDMILNYFRAKTHFQKHVNDTSGPMDIGAYWKGKGKGKGKKGIFTKGATSYYSSYGTKGYGFKGKGKGKKGKGKGKGKQMGKRKRKERLRLQQLWLQRTFKRQRQKQRI